MFALAYLEPASKRLLLARDHAGIKPLYYLAEPGGPGVAFSSRYDALFLTGWLDPDDVRPEVLDLYLELCYVPAPFALHRGAAQVEPGGWVEIDEAGVRSTGRWWDTPDDRAPDLRGPAARQAAAEALDAAVDRQRIADVEVGVFLSGGIDSPLVAATARHQQGRPIDAFTIGSKHWKGDESDLAADFARQLDLHHQLLDVTDDDAARAVDDAVEATYEPLGDYSIVPTLLVSELAVDEVTVALSGDGGDELFFGYERPLQLLQHARAWRLPLPARRAALVGSRALGRSDGGLDALAHRSPGHFYRQVHGRFAADDRRRVAPGLPGPTPLPLYDSGAARALPADASERFRQLATFARRAEFSGQLQRVLKKVDMASMHHSLEVRVPILDRDVIDVACRIDPADHLAGGRQKAVLVDLLAGHVDRRSISEVKRGFNSPMSGWMNGALAERVDDTLLGDELGPVGVFDRSEVRRILERHRAGEHRTWVLWTLLSLQWFTGRTRMLARQAHRT